MQPRLDSTTASAGTVRALFGLENSGWWAGAGARVAAGS